MPKKGGKKMAKMTEEEQLLYMQQKMLEEEEIQKKKEDMLNQFLKDKLSKEEHNTRLNTLKLNEKWRTVMREAKAAELRNDIEILSQTFERIVDRKDGVIRALTKDLEEAEEQYATALRNHIQNVDKLVDLQRSRLLLIENEFEAELASLKEEFDAERQQMIVQHEQEMTNLEDIMYAMDQIFGEVANEARQEFNSTRDDLKNKSLEEKHSLRVNLEGLVEDLWLQFQHALKNYIDSTEDRKIAFETLKARDEKSAKEIEMQMKKLQKMQDTIAALKVKLAANSRKCEAQNKTLRDEKEAIKQHFLMQKSQMNYLRAREHERLIKLTLESNVAIKTLKNVCDKGEHILKMAEMCRRLETEEEKVLPFYASSLTPEEENKVQHLMIMQPCEELAEVMMDYVALEQFWKRYNKVLLDQVVLQQEKRTLLQENRRLRQLLKQYLDGISVNEEILSNLNPLIVINNKTNVKMSMPVIEAAAPKPVYNVIEAAHIINHTV
ncbi:dynein regulatory complex subunit 2 [Scyliorhinus canicula]|uniref:dynein regulatory complex subunit 2 n=1 Tax=Scyliorhinus canicula TaxID=7830 RepID=UPI0018F74952|nr:dynein regulatory complex subunit 2 [Scyliorhinus canicula]XP_038642570.1 dynein regulatory complex subunit 2 [Scyliorhinus canicula]